MFVNEPRKVIFEKYTHQVSSHCLHETHQVWMRRVSSMNASCNVKYMHVSCHTWRRHVTYKCVVLCSWIKQDKLFFWMKRFKCQVIFWMRHIKHEGVVRRVWVRQVIYTQVSRHTWSITSHRNASCYECIQSHVNASCHMWMSNVAAQTARHQCPKTVLFVASCHIWIRHVNCMQASCHVWMRQNTCEWVKSHTNESNHIWTSHITYEWVIWMCQITYEWVKPHMNESSHISKSHITYE